jgi:hypothetical protein
MLQVWFLASVSVQVPVEDLVKPAPLTLMTMPVTSALLVLVLVTTMVPVAVWSVCRTPRSRGLGESDNRVPPPVFMLETAILVLAGSSPTSTVPLMGPATVI